MSTIKIVQNSGFRGYNVSNRSMPIKYIVIHYVGDVGSAANNVAYFNGGNRNASADFFVGHSGEIYQYNPDLQRYYSWHCGGGRQTSLGGSFYLKCKNANSIGIEMCCRKSSAGDFYFESATVNSTVELVRSLMSKYNIPSTNVIRHFDVTGKYCPWVAGWIPPTGSEIMWEKFKKNISGVLIDDEESEATYTVTLKTLKKGSKGAQVYLLQRLLRMYGVKGSDGKVLNIDGQYGDNVVAAVKKYQKKKGLTDDGVCGPKTWKAVIGF